MSDRPNRKIALRIIIALAVASALVAVYFCKPRAGEAAYRIGVVAPLTGEGASYGDAMKKGIDMAIEQVNKQGNVRGRRLEAVYEDDKLTSKDGVAAFNKLVSSDHVPVIIGSAASKVTLSLAPLAEQQHVVLFSSISTADELKDAGDYIFRNVPPNSGQGRTAAAFVREQLKPANVAILYKNDDYGTNLAASFRAAIAGLPVVFDEPYDPLQKDYRSLLSRLREKNPGVVFFPGNYQDNALILKQARESGLTAPFIGGDGGFSEELITLAGNAAEGSHFTMMGIPKSDKINAFLGEYQKKYGAEEPNVYVYYAYDALMMVAEAIKKGGYTAEGIKTALYSIKLDGLTGETRFDRFGEVNKPYSVYDVRNGRFDLLNWRPSSPF